MEFTTLNSLNFDWFFHVNGGQLTKMCLRLNSMFNKTHTSRSNKQYSRVTLCCLIYGYSVTHSNVRHL